MPTNKNRPATCHPDRKQVRKGLCQSCYNVSIQRANGGKPGQIRCGFETLAGAKCLKWRDLDQQCGIGSHARTLDELERIAVAHCEVSGEQLPPKFGDAARKLEEHRDEWIDKFIEARCKGGESIALAIGIPNHKNFVRDAKKFFHPLIEEYYKSRRWSRNRILSELADIAEGPGEYLVWVEEREEDRFNKKGEAYAYTVPAHFEPDGEEMLADGRASLVKALGESQRGTQTITFESRIDAMNLMADIAGWKSKTLNLSKMSDEEIKAIVATIETDDVTTDY